MKFLGLFILITPAAFAGEIFVSAYHGDDTQNNGTETTPYKTIGKAAATMAQGDTCTIAEGIYRESIVLTKNNLTFRAAPGETVVVSGCDLVEADWQPYTNGIWQTAIASEVKQLFANGERMNLARYPNEDGNMFSFDEWEPTETIGLIADGASGGIGQAQVLFDSTPGWPANHWVGGYYTGRNGPNPFTAAVGKITASGIDELTIEELAFWSRRNLTANSGIGKGRGYIINHINALDSPSEWVWENEILYFQPLENPNQTRIEIRTRQWAFDLRWRSNILLDSIHLHAAGLFAANTTGCTVRNSSILYPAAWSDYSYGEGHDYGGYEDGSCGIYLSGSGNTFTNTYIAHSWGSGIRMDGSNNTITDSIIKDINWCGRRMSPVQCYGTGNTVQRCTIRNTGRDGIDGGQKGLGFRKYGTHHTIRHNRIEHVGRLCTDNGFFYMNLQGASVQADIEIAYNQCFTNHSDGINVGIYLDNGTSGATVHHNLLAGGPLNWRGIWANDGGTLEHDNITMANNTILDSSIDGIVNISGAGFTPTNMHVYNNLMENGKNTEAGVYTGNNSSSVEDAHFENAANHDYRLAPGSSHIDAGRIIPGITDGYVGTAPDRGAFETGAAPWIAGTTHPVALDYTTVDTDSNGLPDLTEHLATHLDIEFVGTALAIDTLDGGFQTLEKTNDLVSKPWKPFLCNVPGIGKKRILIFQGLEKSFFRLATHAEPISLPILFEDPFDLYSPAPANGTILNTLSTPWESNGGNVRLYNAAEAESGDYYIQLLGAIGGGSLWTTLPTEIGTEYLVNFTLSVSSGNGQKPQMRIGATGTADQFILVLEPLDTWQYAGYSFIATQTNTTVTFREPNVETSAQAIRLDSVKIFELP